MINPYLSFLSFWLHFRITWYAWNIIYIILFIHPLFFLSQLFSQLCPFPPFFFVFVFFFTGWQNAFYFNCCSCLCFLLLLLSVFCVCICAHAYMYIHSLFSLSHRHTHIFIKLSFLYLQMIKNVTFLAMLWLFVWCLHCQNKLVPLLL